MALSNVSNNDTFYVATVIRMNQLITLLNQLSEGNAALSGTITLTNPSLFGSGITLNIANGMIAGDAGLVSNLRGEMVRTGSIKNAGLQNTTITLKTDYPNQMSFVNPAAPLGNTVNINITPVTSTDDATSTNIASAQLTNTIHQFVRTTYAASNTINTIAVGAYDFANVVNLTAAAAFATANAASTSNVAPAFDQANTANTNATYATLVGVGAFDRANAVNTIAVLGRDSGNTTNVIAVLGRNLANTANLVAVLGRDSGNTTNTIAVLGRDRGNTINVIAVNAYDTANGKLSSANATLTGTVNFGQNSNLTVRGSVTAPFANNANKNVSGTGTLNWNLRDGPVQYVVATGAHTWVFTGWPATANTFADIQIVVRNAGAYTISYSNTINWMYGNGQITTTFSDLGITFETTGNNLFYFWSTNQGTTIYGKAM